MAEPQASLPAAALLLVQDALTDAVLRVDGQREIDGQLYYGETGSSRAAGGRQQASGSTNQNNGHQAGTNQQASHIFVILIYIRQVQCNIGR